VTQPALSKDDDFYLPDFCSSGAALIVVLIVALVALTLTLAREGSELGLWLDLARRSMFLLWAALLSAALLCWLRQVLARQTVRHASAIAFAVPVLVTALISSVAIFLGHGGAGINSPLIGMLGAKPGLFILRSSVMAAIVAGLALRYFYVSHQWRHNVQMEARSRIDALQARIRPHFLFNSLNTIAALTRSDALKAEEAVQDLADLFRVSLSEARRQITLKEELEVARIYQRIEQLRLGSRLHVLWLVEDLPMRSMVPSLIVQPLLENAIYHGIEPLPSGGTVTVRGAVVDGGIELSISNPHAAKSSPAKRRNGNRVALANVVERLRLAFGDRGTVAVDHGDSQFTVTLRFPVLE
jgi:two-component system, LytTR family, sensor histidine kinase AlgZ